MVGLGAARAPHGTGFSAGAVLSAAAIALLSVVAMSAGPTIGLIFATPIWVLGGYVLIAMRMEAKSGFVPETAAGSPARPATAPRRRVLVLADEGLESPVLRRELAKRPGAAQTELRIVVPVGGGHSDPVELAARVSRARARADRAERVLAGASAEATSHVDFGEPLAALAATLTEFPADEVVLVPGAEREWVGAGELARRVRAELGVPVAELA